MLVVVSIVVSAALVLRWRGLELELIDMLENGYLALVIGTRPVQTFNRVIMS